MIFDSIFFENKRFSQLRQLLSKQNYSKILVLLDENTYQHCFPILEAALGEQFHLELIHIPSGENYKTLATCQVIWQKILDYETNRQAVLLNLGGGVIGDMGGFCAATYKRGIDFIQIPTTLLAQVDASVGGKLGIDFKHLKNMIGTFQEPKAVCIHTAFLKTLSYEELRSGWAEIIKHALVADADYWQNLQVKHLTEVKNWDAIVQRSIAIKSQIVRKDPKEKDIRKVLNFGHTIGHAIESSSLARSNPLKHGEAVALGMLMESYLAKQKGDLPNAELIKIQDYILQLYPYYSISTVEQEHLLSLVKQDKKNESNGINFTLLDKIGIGKINCIISIEGLLEALDYYKKLA